MTALVDWQIREQIEQGRIVVEPYTPALVNPSSLDIILGGEFATIYATGRVLALVYPDGEPNEPAREVPVIDLTRKESFDYRRFTTDAFILPPRSFCLGVALERFELPDDISFKIIGKSSWARVGLDNSSAGGWAECGFPGSLVLEICNLTDHYQKLTKGMKCAQLVFEQHEAAETAYNKRENSKYVNQEGLVGSKGV